MQVRNVVLVDGARSAFGRGGRGKLVATRLDEAALRDVHAIPFASAHLPQEEVGHSAHVGLEQNAVLAGCLNDYFPWLPIPDNLQGLVYDETFIVQPGSDENPVSWIRSFNSRRDCYEVPPVHWIDDMRWGFGLRYRASILRFLAGLRLKSFLSRGCRSLRKVRGARDFALVTFFACAHCWLCPGLFSRRPSFKGVADFNGNSCKRSADLGRSKRLETKLTPIDVIAGGDDFGKRIGFPPLRIVKEWAINIIDRQDQVVAL